MELKLGKENVISSRLQSPLVRNGSGAGGEGGVKSTDGRLRFPRCTREEVYRHLIECIRQVRPDLEIGLCLEEEAMFAAVALRKAVGRCNCVL